MNTENQNAKAHRSAWLCFALALLTASTTVWFVVEGIQATEPESSARWAKVASGVLLLILEMGAFGLAGQWPEHKKVLRPLGFAILALEITLMSVSQISICLTAGKAASNGAGTVEEIRAQAKESRLAAEALRADAEKLRKSKHGWLQEQAGQRSAAAAEQSKNAADAVASLEKHAVAKVSTPIVEIVGQGGLIALSVALSLALSLSCIVLMHVAGSLWRRAAGALPVDQQILELLHKIHSAPVAPGASVQAAEILAPAPALAAPVAPAPALTSFKAAEPIEPKDYSTGLFYSSKIKLAGAGLLAATAAPMVYAAPAVAHVNVDIPPYVNVHIPAPVKMDVSTPLDGDTLTSASHVNVDIPPYVNVDILAPVKMDVSAPLDGDTLTSASYVNVDIPPHVNVDAPDALVKVRKARVARDGAVMDTGVGEHDGYRYRRALKGVKAGQIRPSHDGLFKGVGASTPTGKRYLEAMAAAGEIVPNPNGRGWVLAQKVGAA